MQLQPMKLLTIVAEDVLKQQMIETVLKLGATGCSYHSTAGKGSRSARHNDAFSENFQMKVVCPPDVAEAILTYISHHFFEHYAVVAWLTDVQVMRGSHYNKKA